MGKIWANGEATAQANEEIRAGVDDLKSAMERLLGGIAKQQEAVGIDPLNEFRDKAKEKADETRQEILSLETTMDNLIHLGSTVCQQLLAADENRAQNLWGGDPGDWQQRSLPPLPPNIDIPDTPPADG